jgi:hypothetical protein
LEAFLRIQADRIVVDNKSQHAFAIDRGQAQALLELAATLPPDTLRSAVIPANDAPQ